jgi:PA domain
MIKNFFMAKFVASFFAIALFSLASQSASAATIVIQNNDQPNVGFNDPTPVSPVGNNTGTTLGQQRLNAFQFAANIWGATLNSSVTITIGASWSTTLTCSANSGTLGATFPGNPLRDFPNAPKPGVWYTPALANSLSGTDLNGNTPEMTMSFNANLGTANCLTGTHFYLGLDNNHGSDIDLVSVLIHEFSHGFGFQTYTNGSTGVRTGGFPTNYDFFLLDDSTGKTWDAMTDAERQTSAKNNLNLAWNGPLVTSLVHSVLGTPRLHINAPSSVAGNYTVGTADFGPSLTSSGVTGNIVYASPTDGCSSLTNSGAISGRIALVDRGNCNFDLKVQNAQNAGAIAVVIGNVINQNNSDPTAIINMSGATTSIDATILIPTVSISVNDGNTLKAQLNNGLNGTELIDTSVPGGADSGGRALIYAPTTFSSGSSISHWDVSEFPNQLMEPNITGDLKHSVAQPLDLTVPELRDIGWSANPIGDNPFFVRQQYLDFLNRQPDSSGYTFWTNDIFNCGIDQGCAEVHRINVSAAFFLSIEFQQTGNLVYKMYKAGFGNVPGTPVAVRRTNFLRDTQTIQNSPNQIIVGQGNWQANLEANKQAFALSFVQKAGFPTDSDAATFVNNLFGRAGVIPTAAETNAAVNAFNAAGGGNAGRAAALRSVCDSNSMSNALFNEAFVLMQYFGYLQRDPDAQTPADYSGFQFWLNKLNSFNGNFIAAEMVKAFLNSTEYRARFGNP